MSYQPRLADQELARTLKALGAVLIEGPKACGKTETARQIAASEVLLDLDDAAREAFSVAPDLTMDGPVPRLIDEWHLEPAIWNRVRREVDKRKKPGQFILTGSAVPPDDVTRHTGGLRIARMRMRPMSLFEAGRSSGDISLADLMNGVKASPVDPGWSVHDIADEVARGGWPAVRDIPMTDALTAVRGYLDAVCRTDINRIGTAARPNPGESAAARRDPVKVMRLIQSVARNIATQAAATTLSQDTGGGDGAIDDDTVRDYLDALTRLMVVEDQPAWGPHMRSKYRLRTSPTRHFVDPSVAVAAIPATPARLLKDLNYLGLLFESMVVRDLRIYGQAIDSGARICHYRDSNNHEVDAIVDLPDGRWAAFEVKLGAGKVDEGVAGLEKFMDQIDTSKCGEPAALGVIIGTGYGYQRKDGVNVIPIAALGP